MNIILSPRDFSEPSGDAHQQACEIARMHKATLIVLHVTDKPVVTWLGDMSALSAHELQEKLWEMLRWPREFENGITVEHRVAEGDPANQILKMAEATNCDLIVMGTHGRNSFSRLFTGSVAETVVFKAPCSVMVARNKISPTDAEGDAQINAEHNVQPSNV